MHHEYLCSIYQMLELRSLPNIQYSKRHLSKFCCFNMAYSIHLHTRCLVCAIPQFAQRQNTEIHK